MRKMKHGERLVPQPENRPLERFRAARRRPFGYMFPGLQCDCENLLRNSPETVENLRLLGAAMLDPGEEIIPGIPLAAIHTFFGQFIDHDITLERGSAMVRLHEPRVLTPAEVAAEIVNSRSPDLELDSVYGPDIDGALSPRDPANPAKMLVREVRRNQGLPPGKDLFHDFPRDDNDESPLIGDSRNDENTVTGQLHVAFLRAHNALVDRGHRFDQARKLLVQHYQWLVLNEFLEHITDPNVVKLIRRRGPRFFNPPPRSFFMPLEFSVAAFRFGHSKVRAAYGNFNSLEAAGQQTGGLDLLFRSGRRLTDEWVIEWPRFLDPEEPERFSRPIDTSLTELLLSLDQPQIPGLDPERNLAVRNLIRGFILRLPTGQAVARAMASQGIRPLTPEQIASVASEIPGQLAVLERTDFMTHTPLWFYVLAEAAFYSRGQHLGPVGSTIVAEVLIAVLQNSTDSILKEPQWRPTLGRTPGEFDFQDLLELAGVF